MARVVDPRLNTAERRRLNAEVRARHQPCVMCGYPIDQTLDRQRHPLSSCVDEWLPRSLGGDPYDPANCNEVHRICGTSKHNHWPITEEMKQRCRTLVEQAMHQPTVTRCW